MISKKTLDARCLLTDTTIVKFAELVGADIGEPVRVYEIRNLYCLSFTSGKQRPRRIAESLDRVTLKKAEAVRRNERAVIRDILYKEGVPFTRLEVYLGDASFGEHRFVFVDGKFYGVYRADERKWEYREEDHGTESAERVRDTEHRG